jgi:hypothetical protein
LRSQARGAAASGGSKNTPRAKEYPARFMDPPSGVTVARSLAPADSAT